MNLKMLNFGKLDEKLLRNKQKKINITEKKKLYKKLRRNKQKKIKQKRKNYKKIVGALPSGPARSRVCKFTPRRSGRVTGQRAIVRPRSPLYRGVRRSSRDWVYKPVRLPFARRGGTKSSALRVAAHGLQYRLLASTGTNVMPFNTGWSHQPVLKALVSRRLGWSKLAFSIVEATNRY